MTNWNKLLLALDAVLGFPNQTSSTVKQVHRDYDQTTGEHVVVREYRVRVNPGKFEADDQTSMPLLAELSSRG